MNFKNCRTSVLHWAKDITYSYRLHWLSIFRQHLGFGRSRTVPRFMWGTICIEETGISDCFAQSSCRKFVVKIIWFQADSDCKFFTYLCVPDDWFSDPSTGCECIKYNFDFATLTVQWTGQISSQMITWVTQQSAEADVLIIPPSLQSFTDFPAYSDTGYSDTVWGHLFTVTLWPGPEGVIIGREICNL